MTVQHEETREAMSAERQVPTVPQADDHLSRLLVSEVEEPWYKSFVSNIRDLINPPKLPPLELTSKPVAVKDIWSREGDRKYARVSSVAIHLGVLGLIVVLGTNEKVQQTAKDAVILIAPDIAPYIPKVAPQKEAMGGGGGGGNRNPLPATKGRLPKIAPRQFTPPTVEVTNPDPKLPMEPTIVVQPNVPLPQIASTQFGDPLRGVVGPPSSGTGSGAGIGSGDRGGVGSGSGAGLGPGSGGGTGGGVYKIGGGVSSPVPIFKPEPEYSEEARKAKFQGSVLLSIVIQADGSTSNIRVIRPLGLGLDEKAIEAVTKWRFRPSMKDGRAVPVQANVEVNFRLL